MEHLIKSLNWNENLSNESNEMQSIEWKLLNMSFWINCNQFAVPGID